RLSAEDATVQRRYAMGSILLQELMLEDPNAPTRATGSAATPGTFLIQEPRPAESRTCRRTQTPHRNARQVFADHELATFPPAHTLHSSSFGYRQGSGTAFD